MDLRFTQRYEKYLILPNILERKEKVGKETLTLDKYIIVIGSPNSSGQIEAKLIRIIPSPEEMVKLNMSEFNNNKI